MKRYALYDGVIRDTDRSLAAVMLITLLVWQVAMVTTAWAQATINVPPLSDWLNTVAWYGLVPILRILGASIFVAGLVSLRSSGHGGASPAGRRPLAAHPRRRGPGSGRGPGVGGAHRRRPHPALSRGAGHLGRRPALQPFARNSSHRGDHGRGAVGPGPRGGLRYHDRHPPAFRTGCGDRTRPAFGLARNKFRRSDAVVRLRCGARSRRRAGLMAFTHPRNLEGASGSASGAAGARASRHRVYATPAE